MLQEKSGAFRVGADRGVVVPSRSQARCQMHDVREIVRYTVELTVAEIAGDRDDSHVDHPLPVVGTAVPRQSPHLVLGRECLRDRERDLTGHAGHQDLLTAQHGSHHNSSVYLSVPTTVGMNGEAKVT